jgi:uncharacterized membrane protein YdbT with pleckstrin-like domain
MNPDTPSEPQIAGYDTEGRPLYTAPPTQPQVVHVSRATEPQPQSVSPELQARHDESVAKYPFLNLSSSEYVVADVRRHTIGVAMPIITMVLIIAVVFSLLLNLPLIVSQVPTMSESIDYLPFWIGGLLLSAAVLAGGYVAIWVFRNNQLFVTNESVIQETQTGLFAHNEQTASLGNIEDVSYDQAGILQMLFNYGSLRMSTEGDETTYRMTYVVNPRATAAIITNATEAYKNGRPIDLADPGNKK